MARARERSEDREKYCEHEAKESVLVSVEVDANGAHIHGWGSRAPIDRGSLVGERGPQMLCGHGHPAPLAKDAADRSTQRGGRAGVRHRTARGLVVERSR